MSQFSQQAVARIEQFLRHYDTDQVSEILADLLHYARENSIDFDSELETAHEYVAEELSMDQETALILAQGNAF